MVCNICVVEVGTADNGTISVVEVGTADNGM